MWEMSSLALTNFFIAVIFTISSFSVLFTPWKENWKNKQKFLFCIGLESLWKKYDTWLSQLHVILWNIFWFIFPERPDTLKTFSNQHYITLCHIIQIVKAFSIFKGYDLRTIFCDVYSHVVWLRNRRKWCLLFLSLF